MPIGCLFDSAYLNSFPAIPEGRLAQHHPVSVHRDGETGMLVREPPVSNSVGQCMEPHPANAVSSVRDA